MAYIDRDKLIENKFKNDISYNAFVNLVKRQPTTDIVERKKGKWIWMGEKGDSRFMCSVCNSKENVPTCNGEPTIWWFCPNCGADMREETEDVGKI